MPLKKASAPGAAALQPLDTNQETLSLREARSQKRKATSPTLQEGSFNEDEWYDDFNHGTFTFDDASPLAAELQAIPWPQSYKPP